MAVWCVPSCVSIKFQLASPFLFLNFLGEGGGEYATDLEAHWQWETFMNFRNQDYDFRESKIMNFGTNEKLLFVIDGDLEI